MYKRWVIDNNLNTDAKEQESIFELSEFYRCIGSSDGTHILILKYLQWAKTIHKGFKLNVPARTYNVTVDHS